MTMTQRTIATEDTNVSLDSLIDAMTSEDNPIIVARDGEPIAAIVPYASLEELQRLRQAYDRAEALQEYRALRSKLMNKNLDLGEDEADEIANRFSHDVIDDLASEGTLRFRRDRQ
jgi:prevent-host-death family protein